MANRLRRNPTEELSIGDRVRRGVTIGLLSTLGVAGLAACSNETEAQPPQTETTTSAPATETPTPAETETPTDPGATSSPSDPNPENTPGNDQESQWDNMELEEYLDSFYISPEVYTTPEEIVEAYNERYERWMNSGLTIQHDISLFTVYIDQTVANIEDRFDVPIREKLLSSRVRASTLVEDIHNNGRYFVIRDFDLTLDDEVQYTLSRTVLNTELVSGDPTTDDRFVIKADVRVTDNADENYMSYIRREHGEPGVWDITRYEQLVFVLEDGSWKTDGVTLWQESDDNSY